MLLPKTIAALAVLASLSTAAPTASASADAVEGFSIPQVSTGQMILKNGALARQKTLLKYGATVPENIKIAASAAAAKQSGSVVANPEAYDESYLCPVQIGTPPQTLMLDFDTGSADLWVFTGKLPAAEKNGHTVFKIKNSKSAVLQKGETWQINYGDGSGASGIVYSDKVVIGPVTATSQAVEAATYVSSAFISDTANDGLVGLASSSINSVSPNQVTTFFDTVKSTLPLALFTSYLRHDAPGTYGFGFLNSSEYTGTITYTSVSFSNGFWEFDASGYSVGSTKYSLTMDCIADTGTTLMYLPDSVLKNYYAKVSGSSNSVSEGGYVFPCNATLPNFAVKISGVSYTVPGSYLNYAPNDDGTGTCFGGLQSSDGIGFNILGDMFLKNVYAVFDEGNSRIGFANQA